ncbi:hypothetical protein DITRI_Ditri03aG0177400 [Diplodiscus trichospermus]
MADGNGSCIGKNFEAFFHGWLIRLENFLQQLVLALTSKDGHEIEQQGRLVQEVLSHYQQYLEEKSRVAKQEVFLLYYPPWLTSFEKTLLWVGGFKPFLIFKLLANSVKELTPEQEETIGGVKYETKKEERELTEAMAAIQESLAIPPLLNLAKRFGRLIDGEALELESAMETLKGRMLRTLERAPRIDCEEAPMVVKTHHVDLIQVFDYGSHRILLLASEEKVNRKVDSSGQQERLPLSGAGFFYEREPPLPPRSVSWLWRCSAGQPLLGKD